MKIIVCVKRPYVSMNSINKTLKCISKKLQNAKAKAIYDRIMNVIRSIKYDSHSWI